MIAPIMLEVTLVDTAVREQAHLVPSAIAAARLDISLVRALMLKEAVEAMVPSAVVSRGPGASCSI